MSSISHQSYRPTSPFIDIISIEKQPPKFFFGSPKYSVIRKQLPTKTSSSVDLSEIETKTVIAEDISSEITALITAFSALKAFHARYVEMDIPIAIPVQIRNAQGGKEVVGMVFSPNRVKIIPITDGTSISEKIQEIANKNNGVAIIPT